MNYFAPETEIVEGFEVFPGAEMTFSTEMRDGRQCALNVQPKTAQMMEDSMRILKLGLITILVLVIITLVGVFKPHHHEPIRNWIVEIRAGWMMDSIRQLAADQIITDEVVRAAIRDNRWGNLRGASWAAREAVFMANQCLIFSVGFDESVEEMCLPEGKALYHEGSTNGAWVEEHEGIPAFLLTDFFPQARKAIFEIVRDYLMTRANVRATYEAKLDVALDEYRRLSDQDKQAFRELLLKAMEAFHQFLVDDDARTLYNEYMRLEDAWHANESDSLEPLGAWEDAGVALRSAITDESFYLFAGRRHAEGGDELVLTYLEIIESFYLHVLTD